MSATQSTMLPLGTPAPEFSLPEVRTGKAVSLTDFAEAPALLVVFFCAHCPYVHHVQPALAAVAQDYAPRGVALVGITANDVRQYPEDAPTETARFAAEAGFHFPILYDESQAVAQAYTAACTPDFFLFGRDRTLVYRGQIDESRPVRKSGTGNDRPRDGGDLRRALEAVLAGTPVAAEQRPSLGCNIKWKPGNEPRYFGN